MRDPHKVVRVGVASGVMLYLDPLASLTADPGNAALYTNAEAAIVVCRLREMHPGIVTAIETSPCHIAEADGAPRLESLNYFRRPTPKTKKTKGR